ncbi:hybrid sensor histidine kinase/response regulator [Azospira restricta]|uniref:Virulence sensor protein BvgS n=1 Tax=Azospira restricta TaxID=404405 RepID=A0A974SMM2_9RHOO|nr:ATP-binding protein [Azospira restricta]QRJ62364.1 response regulator [Azospira restricta]
MKRLWLLIAALFVLLEGVGGALFYRNHRAKEDAYLAQYGQVAATAYRSSLNMYALATDTLYTEAIARPEVLRAFAAGGAASGAAQAHWRAELLRLLQPSYEAMKKRQIRQLHFHLPDGRSFLRFHLPERFGDPLFEQRPSVRIANLEQRVVEGFETGKVVTGFRYVHPLSLDGRHLGTVETSLSFAAIRSALAALAPQREFALVVLRSAVAPKLFAGQERLYGAAAIHPDFLVEDPQRQLADSPPAPSATARAIDAQLRNDAAVQAAMSAGQATTVKTAVDGEPYAVSLLPMHDVEQRLAGYLVSYTPAGELTAMQRELFLSLLGLTLLLLLAAGLVVRLEESRVAAEAASLAKSRFLATMSHEIRTPMNGILGMAQLLRQPQLNDADRLDYARTLFSSGRTLLALLDDVLDFSKIEAGKLELESSVFDPARLLRDTDVLFAEAAARKGLRLSSRWHGPPGQHYRGDPIRLQQMLSNLASNAIKFTPAGAVRIEARERRRDAAAAELEFIVADTGIGIPFDKQRLLFHPFSQVDSSTTRRFGGTGLGLSIVRSLAQLMGGDVGLESGPGKGSRFSFHIRAALAPADEALPEAPPAVAVADAAQLPPPALSGCVLVVEDNATNRKVIALMLGRLGLQVALAEDGLKGVAAVTEGEPPDLVLMDVQMPGLDGYAATERIRHWERQVGAADGRRLPIVALTADAYETDRQRALAVGMDDFMAKPVDLNLLAATLAKWLPAAPVPAGGEGDGGRPAAPPPVLDAATMLGQLAGNRDIARVLIESSLVEMPEYFVALAEAVATAKWNDAERLTHTMKSLAAQVGGARLSGQLRDADERLRRGERLAAAEVDRLQAEYGRLAAALTDWLAGA